ncbi:MAG: hypothetical protein OQJ84_06430, partial [Xanthomonadales bacterium]|nr:hypothetical protein [Xanthomonadales bacterium]
AFLTLSMAVMGLGLGALSLRFFPRLQQATARMLVIAAVFAAAGPVAVIALGLEFSQLLFSPGMLARFLLAVLLLGLPYFCVGVALAALFKKHVEHMDHLYMGDMLGAGLGVLAAIVAMNTLGTPAAVFLIPVPTLIAAMLIGKARLRFVALLLCVVSIGALPWADGLLEGQREERAPVIYKHWDAMAKIKVFDYGAEARGINIDNVANTPIIAFDGDWQALEEEPIDWDINVGNLVGRFDHATFLSLGAGGGADVMQALNHGATEIHAVEVNPHINRMLLEGDPDGYLEIVDENGKMKEFVTSDIFSGHLYLNPKVNVVSEDARTYVRRFHDRFNVIYSLSSNTFSALGSGSFAFAENYLFTVEAFMDYWNALTDDGFLVIEHQFYMPRLVSDVMVALAELGIENPGEHLAVYTIPNLRRHVMLLSKEALDNELRQTALGELNVEGRAMKQLVYPLPAGAEDNLINRIVTQGWENVADTAEVDVSPTRDDLPFVAQMGLLRNFEFEKLRDVHPIGDVFGFPLSKSILALIAAVVLAIVVPLNLLPYLFSKQKLPFSDWAYFFAIGLAFMIIEIILIQKYTLLIGASIYSIATVLLTLLIASGVGARYARRFAGFVPFMVIAVWVVLLLLLDGALINATNFMPMPMRALSVALVVFPLGFFMGMPFVKGALRVGELIDWGFAVNGAASVLGATLAIVLAFNIGYTKTLLVAVAVYILAGLLLSRKQV